MATGQMVMSDGTYSRLPSRAYKAPKVTRILALASAPMAFSSAGSSQKK